ncbi:MAG: hypothetical protein QOJ59_164 [Thermomicrobiales bacterium]|jgi:hypothetical protein|nr:hypothetical protein [Thermomicrobiales bacterium]
MNIAHDIVAAGDEGLLEPWQYGWKDSAVKFVEFKLTDILSGAETQDTESSTSPSLQSAIKTMYARPERAIVISSVDALARRHAAPNPQVLLELASAQSKVVRLRGEVAAAKKALAERHASGDRAALRTAFDRLRKIAALEPNWNSYRAKTLTPVAVAQAHTLVLVAAKALERPNPDTAIPWAIAPLADGGVQLEWRNGNGAVEVEITPDGKMEYLVEYNRAEGFGYEEGEIATADEVPSILARIFDV